MNKIKQIFIFIFFTFFVTISIYGILYRQSEDSKTIVTKNMIEIFDAPNGNKTAIISKGSELKVIEDGNNWVKVQITGYVHKSLITPEGQLQKEINTPKNSKIK